MLSNVFLMAQTTLNKDSNLYKQKSKGTYQLAIASFDPLNDDIFIADSDGSNPKSLHSGSSQEYDAFISKDGKWIFFTLHRNGSADIYRVHPDGSGLEQLTNDPAFDDQTLLSPDGKSISFVSSRNSQTDIYTLDKYKKSSQYYQPPFRRFQANVVALW